MVVTYFFDNAWGYNPIPEGPLASTLGTLNPLRYRSYVYDTETGFYYLQSRYYDPQIGRFINADAFVSTGQGLLGNNMFAYCNNNPSSCLDPYGSRPVSVLERFGDIPIPTPTSTENKPRNNDAAVSAFYGVSSSDDIPPIPDGAMLFVENIISVNVGPLASIVRGKTIVMDRDKYCEYFFWGVGAGISGVSGALLDKSYTKGYVYGLTNVTDYCGLFLGTSSNLVTSVQGGAWAPSNGVYAEIIGGTNITASVGTSATYYFTSQADWIYGPVDFYIVPNVYPISPLNPRVSV